MNLDAPPWLVDVLDAVSVWDLIVWGLAVAAVVVFIYRKGWRWVIRFARAILATAEVIDSVRELPEFITRTDHRHADLLEKVDGIYHETHNNDGSSIKDAVDRVEQGVAGLYGRIESVEGEVRSLHATDDELRDEIEKTGGARRPNP